MLNRHGRPGCNGALAKGCAAGVDSGAGAIVRGRVGPRAIQLTRYNRAGWRGRHAQERRGANEAGPGGP